MFLSQTTFTNNTAHSGGALYTLGAANIQDSVFTENHAMARGVDEGVSNGLTVA